MKGRGLLLAGKEVPGIGQLVREPLLSGWRLARFGRWGDVRCFCHLLSARLLRLPLLVVDGWPIDGKQDLETARAFIGEETEAAYYAVRPNDFTSVERFALARFRRVPPLSWKNWAMGAARRLLPRVVRRWPPLRALARRVSGIHPAPETGREAAAPVPAALSLFKSLNAVPWRPPSPEARERDLVDRVALFFPCPQTIHVVLLNRCNLSCVMCPYHSPRYRHRHRSDWFEERRVMERGMFEKVAAYAGTRGVSLQFGQIEEPLLHREFLDFVRLAKRAGVPYMHLTTNGTLLGKSVSLEELTAVGLDSVMFSIDASSPETYQAIRGGDLAVLEETIRRFIRPARARGIRVGVSFILQAEARSEREAFLRRWREAGLNYVTFYQLSEYDERMNMVREESFYRLPERYPCASPWVQAVVFPAGEVSLCCKALLDLPVRGIDSVGTLAQEDFEAVWTGERMSRIRRELLRGEFREFDMCRDCLIWSATSSFIETGPGYVRQYNETMETYTFTG